MGEQKAAPCATRGSIDWIVMRNRLATTEATQQAAVAGVLEALRGGSASAWRRAWRPGHLPRAVPVRPDHADLRQPGVERNLSMSHITARQEVRALLAAVGMEGTPADAGTG